MKSSIPYLSRTPKNWKKVENPPKSAGTVERYLCGQVPSFLHSSFLVKELIVILVIPCWGGESNVGRR